MKKWFGLWIVILVVLIVVYHEEPQKLSVMEDYNELYDFEMQEPYAEELVFANKVDEIEHREYLRIYSYDEGKSWLSRLFKGDDAVVSLDPTKQGLVKMSEARAEMMQERLDFMAAEMKKVYLLPDGKNIHELFDERVPKAADADYMFYKELANGNFYLALYFEKTGELHTFEWRQ